MSSKQISLLISVSILSVSVPAYANPMGLNQEDLAFCSQVRDVTVKETVANSENSSSGRVETNFDLGFEGIIGVHGDSRGSGWDNHSSSSSRDYAMSQYESKDCDTLLRTAGQVTIAEINANSREAIARIQAESWKYSEDTKRLVANLNLEAIRDTNQTNRDIANIHSRTSVNTTLVNAGTNLLGNLINPPSRGQEAAARAEVEKAKIRAEVEKQRIQAELQRERLRAQQVAIATQVDPVAQLLAQWGWTQVQCVPETVYIIGLANTSVCVSPTTTMPAGQYSFNRTSNQLIPLASAPAQVFAPVQPQLNVTPVQNQQQDNGF